MPPPDSDISVGELGRQVRDALQRITSLTDRLGQEFVSKGIWDLYTLNQTQHEKNVKEDLDKKVDISAHEALKVRVAKLEDTLTWVTRAVIGFVILAVLAAVFVASGGKPT